MATRGAGRPGTTPLLREWLTGGCSSPQVVAFGYWGLEEWGIGLGQLPSSSFLPALIPAL
jgi:hypothetical protein